MNKNFVKKLKKKKITPEQKLGADGRRKVCANITCITPELRVELANARQTNMMMLTISVTS